MEDEIFRSSIILPSAFFKIKSRKINNEVKIKPNESKIENREKKQKVRLKKIKQRLQNNLKSLINGLF